MSAGGADGRQQEAATRSPGSSPVVSRKSCKKAGAAKPKKDGSPARITKAQTENLSYYDATYLELARRKDLPLKTWDTALKNAFENPK